MFEHNSFAMPGAEVKIIFRSDLQVSDSAVCFPRQHPTL